MNLGPMVALVVDSDRVRGTQLVKELERRSDVRASLVTRLRDAVIAMHDQHPSLVIVSEDLGRESADLLQGTDPDAVVVVVHDRAA